MASNLTFSDNKELEQALKDLLPLTLDEDFLTRLDEAANDQLIPLSEAELRFEDSLRSHSPAGLPAEFLKALEGVVADVPFPINGNILLFPKAAPAAAHTQQKTRRTPMWAAAAAVALIGGTTALLLPNHSASGTSAPIAQQTSRATPTTPASAPNNQTNFSPYIMNTTFSDAKDEGVSWHQPGTPHRILKTTYIDQYTLKNEKGETITVEQPRTEYIFVPEKMD